MSTFYDSFENCDHFSNTLKNVVVNVNSGRSAAAGENERKNYCHSHNSTIENSSCSSELIKQNLNGKNSDSIDFVEESTSDKNSATANLNNAEEENGSSLTKVDSSDKSKDRNYENYFVKNLLLSDLWQNQKSEVIYENLCYSCGYGVFEAKGKLCNFCHFIANGNYFAKPDIRYNSEDELYEHSNIYENICENCKEICGEKHCDNCFPEKLTPTRNEENDTVCANKTINENIVKKSKKTKILNGIFGTLKKVRTIRTSSSSNSSLTANVSSANSNNNNNNNSGNKARKLEIVHNVDGYQNVFKTNETFDLAEICKLKQRKFNQTSNSDNHIYGKLRKSDDHLTTTASLVSSSSSAVVSGSTFYTTKSPTASINKIGKSTKKCFAETVANNSKSDPTLHKISSNNSWLSDGNVDRNGFLSTPVKRGRIQRDGSRSGTSLAPLLASTSQLILSTLEEERLQNLRLNCNKPYQEYQQITERVQQGRSFASSTTPDYTRVEERSKRKATSTTADKINIINDKKHIQNENTTDYENISMYEHVIEWMTSLRTQTFDYNILPDGFDNSICNSKSIPSRNFTCCGDFVYDDRIHRKAKRYWNNSNSVILNDSSNTQVNPTNVRNVNNFTTTYDTSSNDDYSYIQYLSSSWSSSFSLFSPSTSFNNNYNNSGENEEEFTWRSLLLNSTDQDYKRMVDEFKRNLMEKQRLKRRAIYLKIDDEGDDHRRSGLKCNESDSGDTRKLDKDEIHSSSSSTLSRSPAIVVSTPFSSASSTPIQNVPETQQTSAIININNRNTFSGSSDRGFVRNYSVRRRQGFHEDSEFVSDLLNAFDAFLKNDSVSSANTAAAVTEATDEISQEVAKTVVKTETIEENTAHFDSANFCSPPEVISECSDKNYKHFPQSQVSKTENKLNINNDSLFVVYFNNLSNNFNSCNSENSSYKIYCSEKILDIKKEILYLKSEGNGELIVTCLNVKNLIESITLSTSLNRILISYDKLLCILLTFLNNHNNYTRSLDFPARLDIFKKLLKYHYPKGNNSRIYTLRRNQRKILRKHHINFPFNRAIKESSMKNSDRNLSNNINKNNEISNKRSDFKSISKPQTSHKANSFSSNLNSPVKLECNTERQHQIQETKLKQETEEDIYQPIWKFKTVGNPRESYASSSDYYDVTITGRDASITTRDSSSENVVEDHGEWETDDEFTFSTKIRDTSNNSGDINVTTSSGTMQNNLNRSSNSNKMKGSFKEFPSNIMMTATLVAPNILNINSRNNQNSKIGITEKETNKSDEKKVSSANFNSSKNTAKDVHTAIGEDLYRRICILYSLKEPKLRAIVYEYDRQRSFITSQCHGKHFNRNCSHQFQFQSLSSAVEGERKQNEEFLKKNLNRSSKSGCVMNTETTGEGARSSINPNNIPYKRNSNIVGGSNKSSSPLLGFLEGKLPPSVVSPSSRLKRRQAIESSKLRSTIKFDASDPVQSWKMMLLDVFYLEDEEDMYVTEDEILKFNHIESEPIHSTTENPTLQRFKSVSSDNLLLDIPPDKKSIGERFRNKLQRGVLKLNSRQSKDKKNKVSYKRADSTSLYLEDGIKPKYPIFGATLDEVEKDPIESNVPKFVCDCIKFIQHKDCIKIDGIYRASGNKVAIDDLKKKLTECYIYDSSLLRNQDVHTITGLLKLFFRELQTPLIPIDLYRSLPENLVEERSLYEIKNILLQIPHQSSLSTLKYLIKHLTVVAHYCSENRMPASNLAIIWGPCILFSESMHPTEIARLNTLTKILIENYDIIFGDNERLVN